MERGVAMGRPTKLTPEVQDRILQAIRAGNYRETAARYGGISPATFYRWLERGERARRGPFREFREAVERAESEAEVRYVAIVAKAATDDVRAAQWWLEHRFPERWGRRQVDVQHDGRVQIEGIYEALAPLLGDPEVARLGAAIARRLAEQPPAGNGSLATDHQTHHDPVSEG